MTGIPAELESEEPTFIRLASQSKAPLAGEGSVKGPHFHRDDEDLQSHIQNGGNVARVLKDDVVAIDVDDGDLIEYIEHLPESLIIKSGGSGFSFHYYYRCSDYQDNQTKLTVQQSDLGSIRSGNAYCAVPPSIHPESHNQYEIYQNRELADLDKSDLTELLAEFNRELDNSQHHGGSGGGGSSQHGVGSPSGHSEPIPEDYPNKEVDLSRTKSWLKSNGFLQDLNRTTARDWSGVEFKLAKCLAEGGFSSESIYNTLERLNHNSKWHNQDENYRKLTVQKAIESAVNDEFVEFSTGDMTSSDEVESHKTESSGIDGSRDKGGENTMPTFEDKESVQVKGGDSDGDRAIQATKVEGQDGSDEFEFVSIRKGRVQEVELTSGESGLMVDIDQTSSKSVGGTQDLDLVIEALEELRDEIQ